MNPKRWEIAQNYERLFWQKAAERIAAGTGAKLRWYAWRAQELEKSLDPFREAFAEKSKILEIGCGPVGIISYFDWGERHAIDPLNNFYAENQELSGIRDKNVEYRQGKGEELPFLDNEIALVILDNVLDHTEEAEKTLDEINRVLRKCGYLYLSVNIHTTWGKHIHKMLSVLKIDKGHPHSFDLNRIRKIIKKHNFSILKENMEEYRSARDKDRQSPQIKDRIKGYAGISEFIFQALAQKQ